ncbi:hypothetical protein PFISCL1PPCAC_6987, partial [Pristionchus fissidentatus]
SESRSYLMHLFLVPSFPVINVMLTSWAVKCSTAFPQACTVLSAELNFSLEDIFVGSVSQITITNTGYDVDKEKYAILNTNSKNFGSSVVVSGPIATLWSGSDIPYTFDFAITKSSWSLDDFAV